jgi:hypothetical protein
MPKSCSIAQARIHLPYEDLTRQRPGLWAALEQFRNHADLDALAAGPAPFEGVRDRSPGRKVRL